MGTYGSRSGALGMSSIYMALARYREAKKGRAVVL